MIRNYVFLLEGNMGAGKSTFLSLIHKHLKEIEVVLEPVNVWHSDDPRNSLLSQFYKNPNRWAYTMETWTMMTRVKEHIKEQQKDNHLKIMERSVYSGHYCFAHNGYKQGFMEQPEWDAYNAWFSFLVEKHCKPPLGFIYLQTDPKICEERINIRNRSGEDGVPLEYLTQIHNQHEQFLVKKESITQALQNVPVLVLNANEEFEHNSAVFQKHLDAIIAFTMPLYQRVNSSQLKA
jgi:deoxyadenosine/deoxycytidine kinase